jgi:predicted nucleotidyltransferase
MLELLQAREAKRSRSRELLRERVRADLRRHLTELLPGIPVVVFGSLVQEGRFHENSDIDIAIEREPESTNLYRLTGELMERLGRPVDIVDLSRSRLAEKIRREEERWTV